MIRSDRASSDSAFGESAFAHVFGTMSWKKVRDKNRPVRMRHSENWNRALSVEWERGTVFP
jgi:hypothetical protein